MQMKPAEWLSCRSCSCVAWQLAAAHRAHSAVGPLHGCDATLTLMHGASSRAKRSSSSSIVLANTRASRRSRSRAAPPPPPRQARKGTQQAYAISSCVQAEASKKGHPASLRHKLLCAGRPAPAHAPARQSCLLPRQPACQHCVPTTGWPWQPPSWASCSRAHRLCWAAPARRIIHFVLLTTGATPIGINPTTPTAWGAVQGSGPTATGVGVRRLRRRRRRRRRHHRVRPALRARPAAACRRVNPTAKPEAPLAVHIYAGQEIPVHVWGTVRTLAHTG
jgi:hypothetical protein